MKPILRAAIVAAISISLPALAAAQLGSMKLNIAAGASLPTGDLGNATDLGYNLTVGVGVKQPASQLGFRVEGAYNEWNRTAVSGRKLHAGGVTGNVTFDLMSTTTAAAGNTLYLIGGPGYYSTGGTNLSSASDFGFNAGAGFRFPLSGFSAYFEARYHSISDANFKFIPITFGLVF